MVTISGMTGKNLDKLMEAVFKIHDLWNKRVSTSQPKPLALRNHPDAPAPLVNRRRIKIRYRRPRSRRGRRPSSSSPPRPRSCRTAIIAT